MTTVAAARTQGKSRARSLRQITGETPARTDTWGVVLAGSHTWAGTDGQRLISSPLAPLLGQPLITYVIEWLRGNGVPGVTVCANSNTAALCRLLDDGAAEVADVDYYKDVMPRGPAGCVRDASTRHVGRSLVVVEGTVFPELSLGPLLDFHGRSGSSLTIVVNDPVCSTGGHDGLLRPAGLYVFSPSALPYISEAGYVDIKESLVPRLRAGGERVMAYVARGEGPPRLLGASAYRRMSAWAVQKAVARDIPPENYLRRGDALVHCSAVIASSARLLGPIWVGPKCLIEDRAVLVGPCTVDAGTVIEAGAVVSCSFIWKACRVGARAVVNDCVLLDGTQVAWKCMAEDRLVEAGRRRKSRWASLPMRGRTQDCKDRDLRCSVVRPPRSQTRCKATASGADQPRSVKLERIAKEAPAIRG